MPLIHEATLFHNALIFQGEIWSMLIKGLKVVLYYKKNPQTWHLPMELRVMVESRRQEGCNFLDSNEERKFHQVSLLMAREQSSLFVNLYLWHCIIFSFTWRVVVISSGISSFIFTKRYIDKKRLELIKAKGRERMLQAQKEHDKKT